MKRTTIVLAAIALATLVILSGCDLAAPPTDRLVSFIADANATTRVYTDLQSHFSPDVGQRSNMTTDTFWDNTFFGYADRLFAVGALTEGATDPAYTGSRVFTSTVANQFVSDAALRVVFVQDGFSWLIRELTVNDGTEDTIQSVTPARAWSVR